MKYFVYILLLFSYLKTLSQSATSSTITHENIGSNVNSYAGEISPIISSDGKTLYFVRDGHSQNKAGQDIWFSTLNEDGKWNLAIHPKNPLNQGYNSGVFNISTDNNQLLVRGAYVDGEYENSGLSIITKNKKGEWNDPEKLEIKNFSKYSSLGKYNGSF
ncbi:MAG: PD40 domain-containing protein [Bacteroidetes bacterium]|nr:PD40 domain-containing protein [Bacteroidota bacterium]